MYLPLQSFMKATGPTTTNFFTFSDYKYPSDKDVKATAAPVLYPINEREEVWVRERMKSTAAGKSN